MSYEITVSETAPRTALSLRTVIDADKVPQEVERGLRELVEAAGDAQMVPVGSPAVTYLADFAPDNRVPVHLFLPIRPDAASAVVPSGPGTAVITLPGDLCAHTLHRGSRDTICDAYHALEKWIGAARFRVNGPPTEVYLAGPGAGTDPQDFVTEVRLPIVPEIAMQATMQMPFAQALMRTRQALAEHGFGIITEIDMKKTFADKLGEGFSNYVILGACNPGLARRALDADPQAGLFLPCNVVVRDHPTETGAVVVDALDPEVLVNAAHVHALENVAPEALSRLRAAIQSLREENNQ